MAGLAPHTLVEGKPSQLHSTSNGFLQNSRKPSWRISFVWQGQTTSTNASGRTITPASFGHSPNSDRGLARARRLQHYRPHPQQMAIKQLLRLSSRDKSQNWTWIRTRWPPSTRLGSRLMLPVTAHITGNCGCKRLETWLLLLGTSVCVLGQRLSAPSNVDWVVWAE